MGMSLNTKIENVQLEASRIVTEGTRLDSLNNLYMETGWEKLKDRREKHKFVQFYKMTKYLTPHYISCLVPDTFGNIHDLAHAMLLLFPSCVREPHFITIPLFHLPFDCGTYNQIILEKVHPFKP